MANYRIVTFVGPDKQPIPGICVGERVVGLAEACKGRKNVNFSTESNVKMLANWDAAEPVLEEIGDELERDKVKGQALSSVKLKAPLLYPNAIYNAAANYPGHRQEMGNPPITPEIKKTMKPYMFLKSPMHCTIGPGEEIRLPTHDVSECVDWEAELGVVIGRKGLKRTLGDARAIVAGYTIFNDLSIRDRNRTDWPQFRTDWFTAKSFETSAPHGPWIVPAKQIPDPYKCKIDLYVDNRHEQDSIAGDMIFNIEDQIEYISARLTMLPGDLIATGTTPGVGKGVDKNRYLQPGNTVRITIGGIGTLENKCVAWN
jgi:2-keto-4-pentenoate hydratase/2-oxohepta-3-ene-1,7-dioic acid hydratase in catechol pathway